MTSNLDARKRRLQFRASHRGTKEADLMIGGFIDRELAQLGEADLDWLERFLEEGDVDIMAWMMGRQPCPAEYEGPMMDAMRKLDFIEIKR